MRGAPVRLRRAFAARCADIPWLAFLFLSLQAVPLASLGAEAIEKSPAQGVAAAPSSLDAVQVSASRTPRALFTTPAAVMVRVVAPDVESRAGVNLSEALHGIPGLVVRERQNFAQDLQISIRGFGTRATFGIRGVRLLLDGMPITMPDGQGQVSNLPLQALSHIEVLRGPASSLYGNAAGGVIQAFSATGRDDPGTRFALRAGADGLMRVGANLRAAGDQVDAHVDLGHFQSDGFRDHSRASRSTLHARLGWEGPLRASLVLNALDQPFTEDPLGLNEAQWRADPRQVAAPALAFNTRKSVGHRQAGIVLEPMNAGSGWRVMAYGGTRSVVQFLAVPVAAQASPTSGGGVVDLESRFGGLDLRRTWTLMLFGRPVDAVAGLAHDRQHQHRLGFENFQGGRLGVVGAKRRDQHDTVSNQDAYAQLDWRMAARWTLQAGWRRSEVRFHSRDAYVATGNPDDSGERRFLASNPVAGLGWEAREDLFLYASWGRGFETPTFDELGYRSDGSAGLNFALDAVRNRSSEVGGRGRHGNLAWQASVFRSDSNAELAVVSNSGGRSSYANAGPARRQGIELALQWQASPRWRHEMAWTRLDAHYLDAFLTCTGTPCPVPSTRVPRGARLPGAPRDLLWMASHWQRGAWSGSVTGEWVGRVIANATGSAQAPGHAVFDLSLSHRWTEGRRAFLRIGNVFDRRIVGSVIVNEGNGRFYEPAPGRQLNVGLDWRW